MDWESLTLPAAFIAGGIVGFVVAIRMFRLVLEYIRGRYRD